MPDSASAQAECVIDLDAIAHNVRTLCNYASGAAVMAVVKADGYNHGALPVAVTALSAGAREIGVATITEALRLRMAGIRAPILCWLNAIDSDYTAAIDADIEIGVSSSRQLQAIGAAAQAAGKMATVSVKVDTGLHRNGASLQEYPRLLDALQRLVRQRIIHFRGVFSHLASADTPSDPLNDLQRQRFLDAISVAKTHGLHPEIAHLANSAATLTRSDLHFDMVRPGIAVYGLAPVAGDFPLIPAMTLQARVTLVKKIAAGEGVSYGHDWVAPRDTAVALLPVGYADGLPRALGGKFEVTIGGSRYTGVGRVCMDQVVVDLGADGSNIQEGDTAVFFGSGWHGECGAQDWADSLGTIHYEVVAGPRGRVSRHYIGGETASRVSEHKRQSTDAP
ncbi:alanine racemase [Rhodococcus sp. NPDC059968]|uniref:alanine racemase n=1 Tax=Rhodococcus sp. NPDC059968 TaxID=3347017 RepID=UPI00367255F6